ncbi:MAG: hypothetical protein K2X39_04800 [Silvanigrellaceae bacterium]|nr:hypothetical protein [Silvanigrellaceae bacterium]
MCSYNAHKPNKNFSYKLYEELVDEIHLPESNEEEVSLDLQYDLYISKLTYLYHLNKQYSHHHHDSALISKSIEITRFLIKNTVMQRLKESLENAQLEKALCSTN